MTPPSGIAELGRTPPSGLPSVRSARRGEDRVPQATVEVNANVPLYGDGSGPPPAVEEPTPRALSARASRHVGSSAPPMLAPGSRRVSSGAPPKPRSEPPSRYRYVSTAPPPVAAAEARTPAPSASRLLPLSHSGERLVDSVKLGQSPEAFATREVVIESSDTPPRARVLEPSDDARRALRVLPTSQSWRPELSLLPEGRRGLRDELYPLALDGCLVLGVLATEGADYRARLSAEIALSLAESGHPRVLVLDADFGRALLQRYLRVDVGAGLSLSEQLAAPPPSHWTVFECTPSLHVLAQAPGLSHAHPPVNAFAACVATLRTCYDFIVIDGPLLDDAAACETMRQVADTIVFSHGRYGPSEITRVRSLFPEKRISLVPAVG